MLPHLLAPSGKIKSTMALADQITALTELINNAPENSRVIEFSAKLAEFAPD